MVKFEACVQDQEAAWTSWELKFRAGWPDSGFVGSALPRDERIEAVAVRVARRVISAVGLSHDSEEGTKVNGQGIDRVGASNAGS
jgi:hypothetical protein